MSAAQDALVAFAAASGGVGLLTERGERGVRAFALVAFVVSLAAFTMVTLLEPPR